MVFVAGPRQVGKTTLAKSLQGAEEGYLSWDIPEQREAILRRELPDAPLLVFDEIHKYRGWRNFLKGLFDRWGNTRQILVVGSARLDAYRFGGDSLQGRYHFLRLHPFSIAELRITTEQDLMDLLRFSGFPEPFLGASETDARRWSREYRNRLIYEDLRSLETVVNLGDLELLSLRLPELVGAPLSVNAIREDLQVSHATVSNWLDILERLYAIVRLSPFGAPKIRAVKKAQKHYHYDWSLVPEMSKRFENLVAMHMLKWVHFKQDSEGLDYELRFFRDIDGRKVDFLITENRRPVLLVEAKWSDEPVSKGLRYLKTRFPEAEAYQISAVGQKDYRSPDGIRVCRALEFLRDLV